MKDRNRIRSKMLMVCNRKELLFFFFLRVCAQQQPDLTNMGIGERENERRRSHVYKMVQCTPPDGSREQSNDDPCACNRCSQSFAKNKKKKAEDVVPLLKWVVEMKKM